MIAAAVAESQANGAAAMKALHLTLYAVPEVSLDTICATIDSARRGTPAEAADLRFSEAAAHYICWNCCGLRFEGEDGICPNCESEALLVPDEIVFALNRVELGPPA